MSEAKFTIVTERENLLLGRREVKFQILHPSGSTPKRPDVKEKIVGRLNVDPALVYILKMKTLNRSWKTVGVAHIYASAERAKQLVSKYIAARGLPKEDKVKHKEKKKATAATK